MINSVQEKRVMTEIATLEWKVGKNFSPCTNQRDNLRKNECIIYIYILNKYIIVHVILLFVYISSFICLS